MRNPPGQGHGSTNSGTGLPGESFTGNLQAPVSSQGPSVPPDLSGPSGQEVVNDPTNLLYRIQSAIPDLHLLLNRYRETTGQVSVREDMIRRTEAQMAEAIRQKEAYIDKLGKELETVYQRHSAESSKFRLEIGNLEEKHKELQDNFDASKKSRDVLEAANRALQSEKELSEKKLQENKAILQRDLDQWKTQTIEEFAVKQRRIEDDIQRQSNESHAVMQERTAELTKTHTKEKETLHTRLLQQLRELETNHGRLRQVLEFHAKRGRRTFEEAQKMELQSCNAWDKERSAIVRERDGERLSLGKGWEEQRRILAAKHESEKDDSQSTWKSTQAQINERAQGNIARLFVKATTELKAVAAKLDNENGNLQRMVEALGEATDFRSKGDTYFIDAFTQLRKQILDLAVEHFRDLQQEPPEHVQKRIPRTIPPFYTNSEASIQLRAAYIEHVVSRALTQRIFQPFLFTLSRRHESADSLFQTMSDKLRHKSIRREAIWRQHTLHAAYTGSSAKQSINKVAAIIVKDKLGELEHFANPSLGAHHRGGTEDCQGRAETWRYARLEREMITATIAARSIRTDLIRFR
ncbi:MAG: hypothetical protein FRX48_09779 [Lasallia pustulata]|uniref:Uncharacterized protein n=1 Tax=Lasallia pustulata TaxID=136370 RepID=A0A5M8PBW5_9LECA|nr:MAG: hypothetical protein FRX48_09779 [Lasallia pustulata]